MLIMGLTPSIVGNCQVNLVPNPSFEDMDSCPEFIYELTPTCRNWFDPISLMNPLPPIAYNVNNWGIATYFNRCNSQQVGIPINIEGIQESRTGDGYAGINVITHTTFSPIWDKFLSYIEVELKHYLEKDYTYYAEFYYSHAELYSNPDPDYFAKTLYFVELGMLFTDSIVVRKQGGITGQPLNIYDVPQVMGTMGPNVDTINWIKVSGTFIANGGEKYLTIGSFNEIDTISKDAYTVIYIDDVKVEVIDSIVPDLSINVYPNPTKDIIWIEHSIDSLISYDFYLFDACGRLVFNHHFGDATLKEVLNLQHIESGIYSYRISTPHNSTHIGKLVVL